MQDAFRRDRGPFTYCSAVDRFCAWYPTIIYETNYTTNRKLVASASVTVPTGVDPSILSVELAKNGSTPTGASWITNPGNSPGSWAFSGDSITLGDTDQSIVTGIQLGTYTIAPAIRLQFNSLPLPGTYSAVVTFTIKAE